MEFNTKLSKLIARRKVIETRKRLNKIVQYIIFKGSIGDFIKEYNKYYENVDVIINDKGKVILNI
nr:MAG: hypothetical protein [Bacteriophage sp.]